MKSALPAHAALGIATHLARRVIEHEARCHLAEDCLEVHALKTRRVADECQALFTILDLNIAAGNAVRQARCIEQIGKQLLHLKVMTRGTKVSIGRIYLGQSPARSGQKLIPETCD